MSSDDKTKTLRGFAAVMIVVLCWSGFNIVSRLGGKSALTPFDLGALRFMVAGCIALPLFIAVLRRSSREQLKQFFIVTCFGGLGYSLAAYSGFSFAPAAHAGVLINGGIPFVTAVIAWLWLKHKPHGRGLLGLLIALGGIVLIGVESFTHSEAHSQQWIGDLAFFYAAISWAIAGLLMRRWHMKPVDTAAMTIGISAVLYLPVYALFLPKALHQVSTDLLLLQGFYQGVIAAIVAGVFYNYANHTIGPHKASLMLALVPGISAILAVPLLGETLTTVTIAGVVLVTTGAVLGATQKTHRKTALNAKLPRN
jgi:drug/metabolite transporter (DMT)-like permease